MLTLQSNKEIRLNKGDTDMIPLFVNVGDNLRPIGYEFNVPIKVTTTLTCDFYEDAWRSHVIDPGTYTFIYQDNVWTLDGEEVDIHDFGFDLLKDATISEGTEILVEYQLIDNDSTIYFQLWPILQDPEKPLMEKVIYPKDNMVVTKMNDEILYREHRNCVDSLGRIILQFNPEDTEDLERGKYLYQIRTLLFNVYTNKYDFKTMTNRTPFYLIDDNFSQRMW